MRKKVLAFYIVLLLILSSLSVSATTTTMPIPTPFQVGFEELIKYLAQFDFLPTLEKKNMYINVDDEKVYFKDMHAIQRIYVIADIMQQFTGVDNIYDIVPRLSSDLFGDGSYVSYNDELLTYIYGESKILEEDLHVNFDEDNLVNRNYAYVYGNGGGLAISAFEQSFYEWKDANIVFLNNGDIRLRSTIYINGMEFYDYVTYSPKDIFDNIPVEYVRMLYQYMIDSEKYMNRIDRDKGDSELDNELSFSEINGVINSIGSYSSSDYRYIVILKYGLSYRRLMTNNLSVNSIMAQNLEDDLFNFHLGGENCIFQEALINHATAGTVLNDEFVTTDITFYGSKLLYTNTDLAYEEYLFVANIGLNDVDEIDFTPSGINVSIDKIVDDEDKPYVDGENTEIVPINLLEHFKVTASDGSNLTYDSIGIVSDGIVVDSGKVYFEKRISDDQSSSIKDDVNWLVGAQLNNTIRAYKSKSVLGFENAKTQGQVYLNVDNVVYPMLSSNSSTTDLHFVQFGFSNFVIRIDKSLLNTLDSNGVEDYLTNSNVILKYEYAEPIRTEIPLGLQAKSGFGIVLDGNYPNITEFDTNRTFTDDLGNAKLVPVDFILSNTDDNIVYVVDDEGVLVNVGLKSLTEEIPVVIPQPIPGENDDDDIGVLTPGLPEVLEKLKTIPVDIVEGIEGIITAHFDPTLPDTTPDPERDKGIVDILNYLVLILLAILFLLLKYFALIVAMFNIPSSTSLLQPEMISGLTYFKNIDLPLFGFTVFGLIEWAFVFVLITSVGGFIKKAIDKQQIA